MIRTLLTTTALALLLTGGAVAQNAATTATPAPGTLSYTVTDSDNLATEIIGKQVYSSKAADAEHIGDINNLVVAEDGSIQAVVIGVGGFLGIGEKNVAVPMDQLQFVTADDNTERYVLETTKEALNEAPAFEWQDDQPTDTAAATTTAPADPNAPATDTAATTAPAPAADPNAPATDTAAATPAPADQTDQTATGAVGSTDNAMAPAAGATTMDRLNREGLTEFDETQLTAEELIGTNVYGTNDEHIGTIGDLALNEDGSVDAIIIDFGGFLGIGTKPVAVAFENLDFLADPNNNRSLVLPITREQMDAAPAFNKDTYTAERDTQRIVVGANTQS
ncbi:MAG TPA: PRC-barrel domain-containing protein [Devosia sp.]